MRANDRNRARIAVVGEITPAAQRGALLAIGTAVASSAGLLAPYIMGVLLRPPRHRSTGSTPASLHVRDHYAGGRRHPHGARKKVVGHHACLAPRVREQLGLPRPETALSASPNR